MFYVVIWFACFVVPHLDTGFSGVFTSFKEERADRSYMRKNCWFYSIDGPYTVFVRDTLLKDKLRLL